MIKRRPNRNAREANLCDLSSNKITHSDISDLLQYATDRTIPTRLGNWLDNKFTKQN